MVNKTPKDQQKKKKKDLQTLPTRAKSLTELWLLHDSPAYTMEQNNQHHRQNYAPNCHSVRGIARVVKRCWKPTGWPTNENDKTISFMLIDLHDECLWILMAWVLSGWTTFMGYCPIFGNHLTGWIGSFPRIVVCVVSQLQNYSM